MISKLSKSSSSKVRDALVWLAGWAIVCIPLSLKLAWKLNGAKWVNVLYIYLGLLLSGIVIGLFLWQIDRIESDSLKFAAQMGLCVFLTLIVGCVLVVVTM